MSLWGKTDNAANSTMFAVSQVKLTPNTANRTTLFGNTTQSAIITGEAVGQFGVDVTEVAVGAGPVIALAITDPGSGYFANATVTISGGGGASATANAAANSIGRIGTINLTAAGTGYSSNPSVVIAAPAAQSFNALTAVSNTADFITISSNKFQTGDLVTYLVAAGNTAVLGLANAGQYYVSVANSTGVKLSATNGGSVIDLTATVTETGHTLTGQTAKAVATIAGAKNKGVSHAGWVLRTEGSGGRAGRVQYETLVAMGSITSDASDDTVLPDA